MKIKVDKITGEIRESDVLDKLGGNTVVSDDFSVANNEWIKAGSYVTTTPAFVSGKLKINSAGAPSSLLCSYIQRNTIARNFIMSVDMCSGARDVGTYWSRARKHFRESSQGNYFNSYINSDGTFNLQKVASSAATAVTSGAIPNHSFDKTYRVVTKAFENFISSNLYENGRVLVNLEAVNSDFAASTGKLNGLGSGDTPLYDNFTFEKLDNFLNIVFLGDSNTLQSGITKGYNTTDELRMTCQNLPVGIFNKGVSGDRITNVSARVTADVTGNKVSKARNICVLQIGTNNVYDGASAATIMTALESLYDTVLATGFEIWAVTVPPRTDNPSLNSVINDLNTLIKKSAKPTKIIDLYSSLISPSSESAVLSGMLRADNLHLDIPAAKIFADKVKAEILKVYASQDVFSLACEDIKVRNIASKSAHPTSYKPVFQDTTTKELYIYTGA